MQIIHKGVFVGFYAVLMGVYTDCNIFVYFWHNDYTDSIHGTQSHHTTTQSHNTTTTQSHRVTQQSHILTQKKKPIYKPYIGIIYIYILAIGLYTL